MTTDEKYRLIAARVTLNGRPAVVCGAQQPFARVSQLTDPGYSIEYAWPTVARIVDEHNGAFQS